MQYIKKKLCQERTYIDLILHRENMLFNYIHDVKKYFLQAEDLSERSVPEEKRSLRREPPIIYTPKSTFF